MAARLWAPPSSRPAETSCPRLCQQRTKPRKAEARRVKAFITGETYEAAALSIGYLNLDLKPCGSRRDLEHLAMRNDCDLAELLDELAIGLGGGSCLAVHVIET